MLKVVVDTNQFVSAIIAKHGASSRLLQAWREHAYILITSKDILQEVRRVLQYPHITKKYCLQEEDINALINLIEHEALVLSDTINIDVIKEDPDDNKILACAIEAEADYIISGDKHLLNLRQYKGIAVITVNEFLKIIITNHNF